MASKFFNIPGTIKQQLLPFRKYGASTVHLFSFKDATLKTYSQNAKLCIAPKSAYTSIADNDLSHTLLFNTENNKMVPSSLSMSTIINNLPCIQVREYLMEAKLNQLVSLFSSFAEGFSYVVSNESKIDELISNFNIQNLSQRAQNIIENFDSIIGAGYNNAKSVLPSSLLNYDGGDAQSIICIVYLLYYRMITATITNIYELPYNGNYILTSDGSQGWTSRGIEGLATGGESLFGKFINYFGSNLSFNMSPTWDGAKQDTPLSFDVTFHLYNDTNEAAVANFLFVNTLIPGNNWMQYHVFQHAPNLFDVNIVGLQRFFMCSAKIECTRQGVLRTVNSKIRSDILLAANYFQLGASTDIDFKIPDVYEIKITFTSLLPNNFNNYLFSYLDDTKFTDTSAMESGAKKFVDGACDELKKY